MKLDCTIEDDGKLIITCTVRGKTHKTVFPADVTQEELFFRADWISGLAQIKLVEESLIDGGTR